MPLLFFFSYWGGGFVELKLPAKGSVSLPRSKEESRWRGARVGEESGEESTHRLGGDGGEEKVGL